MGTSFENTGGSHPKYTSCKCPTDIPLWDATQSKCVECLSDEDCASDLVCSANRKCGCPNGGFPYSKKDGTKICCALNEIVLFSIPSRTSHSPLTPVNGCCPANRLKGVSISQSPSGLYGYNWDYGRQLMRMCCPEVLPQADQECNPVCGCMEGYSCEDGKCVCVSDSCRKKCQSYRDCAADEFCNVHGNLIDTTKEECVAVGGVCQKNPDSKVITDSYSKEKYLISVKGSMSHLGALDWCKKKGKKAVPYRKMTDMFYEVASGVNSIVRTDIPDNNYWLDNTALPVHQYRSFSVQYGDVRYLSTAQGYSWRDWTTSHCNQPLNAICYN